MHSFTSILRTSPTGPLRPVLLVHGTGGRAEDIFRESADIARRTLTFNALLICPQFPDLYQFIALGTDQSLIAHVEELSREHPLAGQWLLYGFSGGAQFAHRFTMQHPHLVQACAALAAGSWTASDGEFFGMIKDAGWHTRPEFNHPEVFANAQRPAVACPGFEQVRWLIGCGQRDLSRYASAQRFHALLRAAQAEAQFFDWPLDHRVDASVYERVMVFFNRALAPPA